MPSEREFLAAIANDPHDLALRLAFADWLEERDDPRSELIRLEEDARSVPIHSAEYWRAKPRRQQLRAEAGHPFLVTLRYGRRLVFADGIPDEQDGRWRLLRALCEDWFGRPLPDLGSRE